MEICMFLYRRGVNELNRERARVAQLGSLHFYSNFSWVSSFLELKFSSSIYLKTQFELKRLYFINRFRLLWVFHKYCTQFKYNFSFILYNIENNIAKIYIEPAHKLSKLDFAMLDSRKFRAELE